MYQIKTAETRLIKTFFVYDKPRTELYGVKLEAYLREPSVFLSGKLQFGLVEGEKYRLDKSMEAFLDVLTSTFHLRLIMWHQRCNLACKNEVIEFVTFTQVRASDLDGLPTVAVVTFNLSNRFAELVFTKTALIAIGAIQCVVRMDAPEDDSVFKGG